MGTKESRFFEKKGIDPLKVMYMTRDERKTVIHMADGSKEETFNTIKGIIEAFPSGIFECINKGVVISSKYVDSVNDNVYTMSDGVQFKGRVRRTKEQKNNAQKYNSDINYPEWEEYHILDKMSLPFCIIELVFDEKNKAIDYVFRYCNAEMESFVNISANEIIDRSFFDIFKNGDRKWLVSYADVAINGARREVEGYYSEMNVNLKIYCYQPKPNYCACVFVTY